MRIFQNDSFSKLACKIHKCILIIHFKYQMIYTFQLKLLSMPRFVKWIGILTYNWSFFFLSSIKFDLMDFIQSIAILNCLINIWSYDLIVFPIEPGVSLHWKHERDYLWYGFNIDYSIIEILNDFSCRKFSFKIKTKPVFSVLIQLIMEWKWYGKRSIYSQVNVYNAKIKSYLVFVSYFVLLNYVQFPDKCTKSTHIFPYPVPRTPYRSIWDWNVHIFDYEHTKITFRTQNHPNLNIIHICTVHYAPYSHPAKVWLHVDCYICLFLINARPLVQKVNKYKKYKMVPNNRYTCVLSLLFTVENIIRTM